jgi:hypothetical protein
VELRLEVGISSALAVNVVVCLSGAPVSTVPLSRSDASTPF